MPNKVHKQIESEEQLDARFDRMKRLPRGTFRTKPGATDVKNCKVKITMLLDAEIVEFYKERAAQPGNPPYQTQINAELRRAMRTVEHPAEQVVTLAMLENPEFLSVLAGKLKKAASSGGGRKPLAEFDAI